MTERRLLQGWKGAGTLPCAFVLVSSWVVALGGCTTPGLRMQGDPNRYYPNASVRLGETGIVVLHFAIDSNGKAGQPIDHDEPTVAAPDSTPADRAALRLIEGAENYIRDATFDIRGPHPRRFTASFVFEVKPCGALKHSGNPDYAISLCRERPARPAMPTPHCRLIDDQLRC